MPVATALCHYSVPPPQSHPHILQQVPQAIPRLSGRFLYRLLCCQNFQDCRQRCIANHPAATERSNPCHRIAFGLELCLYCEMKDHVCTVASSSQRFSGALFYPTSSSTPLQLSSYSLEGVTASIPALMLPEAPASLQSQARTSVSTSTFCHLRKQHNKIFAYICVIYMCDKVYSMYVCIRYVSYLHKISHLPSHAICT